MTKTGICKLCKNLGILQLSHAVGDSSFKRLFKTISGKAVTFSDSDDEYIQYSSDSWADHQLCEACERHLNESYEQYSMRALRGRNATITKSGVTFSDIDLHKLNLYFLSIFWRAANSDHPSYKQVVITPQSNEYLRDAILHDKKVPIARFSVKLSRLTDLSGGFTKDALKQVIVAPFPRIHGDKRLRHISMCFTFEGFFTEIYMPGLKLNRRNEPGVIHETRNILHAPYLDIFSIPEIVDVMVIGYKKYIKNKSRVR